MLSDFPELADAAGATPAFEASLAEGKITLRAVFLGNWDGETAEAASRGSSLHADLSSNWYAQTAGRKKRTGRAGNRNFHFRGVKSSLCPESNGAIAL